MGLFDGLFGSSEPSIIIPETEQGKAYQTFIPQSSFQNAAEYMKRLDEAQNRALDRRYDQVGTDAEIGARQKDIQLQEKASYLASLPKTKNFSSGFRPNPDDNPAAAFVGNTAGVAGSIGGLFGGQVGARPESQTSGSSGGAIGKVLAAGLRGISNNIQLQQSPAVNAAEIRLQDAKNAYNDAVNKVKTSERAYVPVTQPGFNAGQYLENYKDLRDAFGSDLVAAKRHFLDYGREEGRTDEDIYDINKGAPRFTLFNPDSYLPREMNKPVKTEPKEEEKTKENSKENDFDDEDD